MADGDDRGSDDSGSLLQKKQEFLESFFKKGAEFTRELLRENDRLRRRLVGLDDQIAAMSREAPSEQTLSELVAKLHELEEERRMLLQRFSDAEAQEVRYGERYEEIEQENNDLASLYVAHSQLHASLDVGEIVRVIIEISLNFIGAERFAIMLTDTAGTLRVLATEGFHLEAVADVSSGQGLIGRVLETGMPTVEDDAVVLRNEPGKQEPVVCYPLCEGGAVIGVVAIWSFLRQKTELAAVDMQMLDMLSQGGGHSLEAARMASIVRAGGEVAHRGTFEEYSALMR